MKKKIIAILVLALVVSTVSVFALGIGPQGGYGGVAVSFKLDKSPLIFSAFVNPFGGLTVGGTADMWAINGNLAGPVNYFAGLGVGAGVQLGGGDTYVSASARVLAGIHAFFLDGFVEPYVQVAYAPTLAIHFNNQGIDPDFFGFDVAGGVRFWL